MLYLQGPDGSNSCCVVACDGATVRVEYGGQGRELQQRRLKASDAVHAQSLQRRTVSRLLSKGYRVGRREPMAVEGCVSAPDDGERLLEYAARLSEGLGSATLCDAWSTEQARRFSSAELGRQGQQAYSPEALGFSIEQTWWAGFVESATFDGSRFGKWEEATSAYALRRFLRHSQCELMRSLRLLGYRPMWGEILAKERLPLLREVKVVSESDADQQALQEQWKSSCPSLSTVSVDHRPPKKVEPKSLWRKIGDWWYQS